MALSKNQRNQFYASLRRLVGLAPKKHHDYLDRLRKRAQRALAEGDRMAWDAVSREVETRLGDAIGRHRMRMILELGQTLVRLFAGNDNDGEKETALELLGILSDSADE